MTPSAATVGWRNWGRCATADFASVAYPRDEAELVALVGRAAEAGQRIRALGSGHSFTPIGVTDGVSVRFDALSGIRKADPATGIVILAAGTRLRDIPRLLAPFGLAMQNLGDIDAQTIAGAIATGTHGTGADYPGITGQVRGLRLVTADGTVRTCSATDSPELFAAARVGLGAFGLIIEVTLQCVPAFLLAADEYPAPLEQVLDGFQDTMSATDHVEFYWFPHSDTALVKANTRLPESAARRPLPTWRRLLDDELVGNGVFGLACAAGSVVPPLIRPVNRLAATLVSRRRYTDHSASVFTSPRRVRFREMEYAVPREALPATLREIRRLIDRRDWRISFPLEVRVAAADDAWLSTGSGRDTAYVAVHRYHRDPFARYFLAVEQILAGAGGRPHWGKLHTRTAEQLAESYPHFDDAVRIRDQVDPDRLFDNAYLQRVLGD